MNKKEYEHLQEALLQIAFGDAHEVEEGFAELHAYVNKRRKRVLPQIKLKYVKALKKKYQDDVHATFVCTGCNKKSSSIGAINRQTNVDAEPNLVCEDCSIADYKERYKFSSKKVAVARRRRMFDVGYLFTEMCIDEFLKDNNYTNVEDVPKDELFALIQNTQSFYSQALPNEMKTDLEETESQSEIEQELALMLPKAGTKVSSETQVEQLPQIAKKDIAKGKFPSWMDCTWKRVICGKAECPVCGKISDYRKDVFEVGGDPEGMRRAFEDEGRSFADTIGIMKKYAKEKNIEPEMLNEPVEDKHLPPKPMEFAEYKAVVIWARPLREAVHNARKSGGFWLQTEAGADLQWYSKVLPAKVYRQLCNNWLIKYNSKQGKFDAKYTAYNIKESFRILERSLKELAQTQEEFKKPLRDLPRTQRLLKDIL